MTPLSPSDLAAYEELAAHLEFDAEMTREEAEASALLFVTSEAYREQEKARAVHFVNENAVLKE